MPVQAVVFDMDGTLIELKDPSIRYEQVALAQFAAVHELLTGRGHALPPVQEFSATLYAQACQNWRAAMDDAKSYTVHDLLAQELPELSPDITTEEVAECLARFESLPVPIKAIDGARSTLEALRGRGLRLALISNSWSTPGSRDAELQRAGLMDLLQVRVYSSTMDVMKPHPAIFEAALSELQVAAGQAVMVGDRLKADISGAQEAGMRAVWLDARGQGLGESEKIMPDATIHRLDELVGLLDLWLES